MSELYARYAPALHRRGMSLLGDSDEVRDLVQETFARYLSASGRWQRKASAFTVLYRIATNAAIDRIRRDQRVRHEPLDPERMARAPGDSARVNDRHDLAYLTAGLPEQDVTVAVLYHLDGYTQDEVAASLDLSRRTVGKILRRFERHVKKRAARSGYAESKLVAANGGSRG